MFTLKLALIHYITFKDKLFVQKWNIVDHSLAYWSHDAYNFTITFSSAAILDLMQTGKSRPTSFYLRWSCKPHTHSYHLAKFHSLVMVCTMISIWIKSLWYQVLEQFWNYRHCWENIYMGLLQLVHNMGCAVQHP